MAFGLGSPVYSGALPLGDAFAMAASFTVGMSMYLLLARYQGRSRSR